MAGRHILFLVHGMGVYGKVEDGKYVPDTDGWFKKSQEVLRAVYKEFIQKTKVGDQRDFDEHFIVEEIRYDDWFERYRADWEAQAQTWDVFNFEDDVLKTLVEVFQGNTDDAFAWTHVADVLLYAVGRAFGSNFGLVRDAVHASVGLQVLNALKKHQANADFGDWSFIAHSLGTSVVNNTLPLITKYAVVDPDLPSVMIPPKVVCMAANVSRALSSREAAYTEEMAPRGGLKPNAYLSLDHRLDPFTVPIPFRPTDPPWSPSKGYVPLYNLDGFYLAKELFAWAQDAGNFSKFASVVPHDFGNYMRQPQVVVELWSRLRGYAPGDLAGVAAKVADANRKQVLKDLSQAAWDQLKDEAEQRLRNAVGSVPKASLEEHLKSVIRLLKGAEAGQ